VSDVPPQNGPPTVRASDADRERVVALLQRALAEGRIDLDEYGERAQAAHAGVTTAELGVLVADLPGTPRPSGEIVGTRIVEAPSNVFGDIKLSGGALPPDRASTVFGDIRIDLRGLRTDVDELDLQLSTVFGDIEVIVPEGVDAELHGRTVFGSRKVQLAPVPRLAGTPLVVVRARTVFGCAAWLPMSSPAVGERSCTGSPSGNRHRAERPGSVLLVVPVEGHGRVGAELLQ
jgi:hypothetical protein